VNARRGGEGRENVQVTGASKFDEGADAEFALVDDSTCTQKKVSVHETRSEINAWIEM
jgi:hypothetical protein